MCARICTVYHHRFRVVCRAAANLKPKRNKTTKPKSYALTLVWTVLRFFLYHRNCTYYLSSKMHLTKFIRIIQHIKRLSKLLVGVFHCFFLFVSFDFAFVRLFIRFSQIFVKMYLKFLNRINFFTSENEKRRNAPKINTENQHDTKSIHGK